MWGGNQGSQPYYMNMLFYLFHLPHARNAFHVYMKECMSAIENQVHLMSLQDMGKIDSLSHSHPPAGAAFIARRQGQPHLGCSNSAS